MGSHAHRGGVDQGVGMDRCQFSRGNKRAVELGGEFPPLGLGAIGQQHPGPGLDQTKTHSPGSPAGADDQHRAPGKVDLFSQGLIGSQPVGVEALCSGSRLARSVRTVRC